MSWMSISGMLLPPRWLLRLLFLLQRAHPVRQLGEVADLRRVARPGAALVEREEAGVAARLQDRARDHGAGGDVDVVGDLQVAEDHRRAAQHAVPADVGA